MSCLTNLSLHHIGFAVRSLDDSQKDFEALGAKFFHDFEDRERNLSFRFAELTGGGGIELVSPIDNSCSSAIENFVAKKPCTPYHVCLQVNNLTLEMTRLRRFKFKQLGDILTTYVYGYPSKGVFMFGRYIGLVELVQEL